MGPRTWHKYLAVAVCTSALGAAAGLLSTAACTPTDDDDTSSSSGGQAMCSLGKPSCVTRNQCGNAYECVDAATRQPCAGSNDCCCVAMICLSNDDCVAPETCNRRTGVCARPSCDPSNPASCPAGQRCINSTDASGNVSSSCMEAPPGADKCTADVPQFSLRTGEKRTLKPTGFSNAGAQVPYATFSYTSSDAAVATVNAGTGEVTAVGGSAGAVGQATITIKPEPSGTTCSSTVKVYGTVGTQDVRAVVFNARTGTPMNGVTVQLRKDSGSPQTAQTNQDGVALFTGALSSGSIKDISAFPAGDTFAPVGYTWLTYSTPGTNDVAFFVEPLPDSTKVAGVKGTFDMSLVTQPAGEVQLGLAAFSMAGALSGLSLESMVGRTQKVDIEIPNVDTYEDVPLPGGMFLKLNNNALKSRIDLYTDGPCPASNPCSRVLWGLGGQVPLTKISSILTEVSGDSGAEVDPSRMLSAVLPLLRKFYHYTRGGLPSMTDQAAPAEGAAPDFTQNVTIKPAYLLTQAAPWTVPTLPTLPDGSGQLSGVVMMTGSMVPGQGVVPLGLTAALDECNAAAQTDATCKTSPAVDGKLACWDDKTTTGVDECAGLDSGDVMVNYAPPHDGLEGTRLVTAAMALDVKSLGAGSLFTSILTSFNDQLSSSAKNTFPAGTFLGFNKGSFNITNRQYAATSAVDGAEYYRMTLASADDKPWHVYFKPAAGSSFTVEIPPLPAGVVGDRVAKAAVQAYKLSAAVGSPPNLTSLVTFNSINMDRMTEFIAAYSAHACSSIYPARACTADAVCEEGFSNDYTCDTAHQVCVSANAGVTVKGSGTCPAGTRELSVPNGTTDQVVCSKIPACEIVP